LSEQSGKYPGLSYQVLIEKPPKEAVTILRTRQDARPNVIRPVGDVIGGNTFSDSSQGLSLVTKIATENTI
jgi:hypothetical protein